MTERSKGYSNRGNCIRAAKVKLGKGATPGTDFTLDKDSGFWHFTPKAKAKRTRVKGVRSSILQQPQMGVVLGMMQRKMGTTVEEISTKLECTRDTGRGMASRIGTAGAPITKSRVGRFVHYHVDPSWHL